jgi:cyclic beta-1,2-glucan synthetase
MTAGQLLSNGSYDVLVTPAGAGYSVLGGYQLTRWASDPTRDAAGYFTYLRDLDSGRCWSAGHQPVQAPPDDYRVSVSDRVAVIVRSDDQVEVRTEIAVAPDADVEWRRHTVTNLGSSPRRLELTTCLEVALNAAAADAGHPAFSKLFVQTEWHHGLGAVLASRRPRSPEDEPLCLGHALLGAGGDFAGPLEWETDRARFIGRGHTLANPVALRDRGPLSGTVGNVLDPLFSLRRVCTLAPGARVRLDAVLTAGHSPEAVLAALDAARGAGAGDAVFGWAGAPNRALAVTAVPVPRHHSAPGGAAIAECSEPLRFANGYGGFSADGTEYVVRIDRTADALRLPPLPWTNVIANEAAGCVVSECGLGFTWQGNSRTNRLTPWHNDPVTDPTGEALYLRDEAAGLFWSPTPSPTPGTGGYETRHGFGYSSWRHTSQSLEQAVTCFMARDEAVKIVRLGVTNRGAMSRSLTMCYYAEWVLGGLRAETAASILTESAGDGRVLLATNPASDDFGRQVAFAAVSGPTTSPVEFTADRAAFLGACGSTAAPAALGQASPLDGRCGGGLDPCAAFRLATTLAPGATAEWTVLLGQAADREAALALATRFGTGERVAAELAAVRGFWQETLGAVRVETPAPAIDLMVNGWLGYQNLSCRLWARSALYQSGGAFGFRDQLQDAAALVYHRPDLTRRQILLHAANQFVEGDVMHWWHPPAGRGIRTRFSDDLLWLPMLTEFYLDTTGDEAVLEEEVGFLTARALRPGEDEAFLAPLDSGTRATVYQHCCLALDRSLGAGAHGLPLIGTGDWNDGMNRVGRLGRGESVWLGFFLYAILERFIPICVRRGDAPRAGRYRVRMDTLHAALNAAGWDGEWYRRAYYDDGTPLGSAASDECRIDAIAQAWAVISGVASPERAGQSLDAMERFLVDEGAGLIRLLTPPFDRTSHDPGYIKGYLPGVRENGGQYTHAALWAVRALAEAGRAERAAVLLEMLSPVTRGGSAEVIATYQAEPYAVAADVYGQPPYTGRAGWTWYTGSAGWMFRVAFESVLGMTIQGGRTLVLRPCLPAAWPGFTLWYRHPDDATRYEVVVRRTAGATVVRAPGLAARVEDGAVRVALAGDGARHRVEVDLGADVGTHYRPSEAPPERITSA